MEIGKKVILFTHFQTEFEMIEKEFAGDKRVVFVKSSMDAKKRQNVVDKFQNDDETQLIFGNIDVMGTGINLTKGDVVLFNSPDWSNKKHAQAEDRAYRLGRIGNVWVVYMIYEGTEEEYIYEVNTLKGDNVEIVIGK
jgi:SNF2 family DNA or RNA helicase